jgi:hypothetical protein
MSGSNARLAIDSTTRAEAYIEQDCFAGKEIALCRQRGCREGNEGH